MSKFIERLKNTGSTTCRLQQIKGPHRILLLIVIYSLHMTLHSILKRFKMNIIKTVEYDLNVGNPQCISKLPLSLGNLIGEASEHTSIFIPKGEKKAPQSPHGKYKNYYLQYIGERKAIPIHKTLKGLYKRGSTSKVVSKVGNLVLKNLVSGKFHASITIFTETIMGATLLLVKLVISTDVELLDFNSDTNHTSPSTIETLKAYSLPAPKKVNIFGRIFIAAPEEANRCRVIPITLHPDLEHSVDRKLLTIVENHVIHLTLRHCGLTIAKSSLNAFHMMMIHVVELWEKIEGPPVRKEYTLLLDSIITLIDTNLLCEGKDYKGLIHNLYWLGETLEAQGRHRDAAWIYIDCGSRVKGTSDEGNAYNSAGLAFKYAGEASKAEWCYVQAWRLLAPFGLDYWDGGFEVSVYFIKTQ